MAERRSRNLREQELLEHALESFSKEGFSDTSLQEIADRLGITRPLFYYYFESKEDLLWKLIGHLGGQLLERARPIAASDQPADVRLRQVLESHIEMLLKNHAAFRVYLSEAHMKANKRARRYRRNEVEYLKLITDLITEGQAEGTFRGGDAKLLARLATGMANSILRWYVPRRKGDADLTAATIDTFLQGIQTKQAVPRRRRSKQPA